MPYAEPPKPTEQLISEALMAALMYGAVADWFELLPTQAHQRKQDRSIEGRRMDFFNRAEAGLRKAVRGVLKKHKNRAEVFRAACEQYHWNGAEPDFNEELDQT